MQSARMIHLKEVAELLSVKLTTLYGDWEERVRLGQIPPADPRHKRPTWHLAQVEAWLASPPAPKAEKARRQKADPEADALRARMQRNREGRSAA